MAATIEVAPRSGAARLFSPAVVQALDSQLRALQPSIGSPQPIAQTLLLQALPVAAPLSEANADGIAAALILKRALSETEVYAAVQETLSAQTEPLARIVAENLSGLRKSIQADPTTRGVFQQTFKSLEDALSADRSLGEVSAALDAFFTGSGARPSLRDSATAASVDGRLPGRSGKIQVGLARADPRDTSPARPSRLIAQLVVAEDLLGYPSLAMPFYEALKSRFKNGNFDEILFPDNPNARGPRLSPADYEKMLGTLKNFLEQHPEETPRLRETARARPFRLESDGKIEHLSSRLESSWRAIGLNLSRAAERLMGWGFLAQYDPASSKKIQDGAPRNLGEPAAQEALIGSLVKQFTRKRSPEISRDIADALLVFEVPPAQLDNLKGTGLDGLSQYAVLEEIERGAIRTGRRLGVPGKILDSLLAQSSLGWVERSNLFRKGTAIVPMSRFEAVFKGVGTGECVRAACNRYFDAFFDDAMHLKILRDGQETGFIGIYKTVDPQTKMRYWFLETIQSPLLSDASSGSRTIRGLLRELQQAALLDGSFLAVPAATFNSYNFKEVVAELEAIPEAKSGDSLKVKFQNPERLAKLKSFNSSDLGEFDQLITRASGYDPTVLTNGFAFNGGRVVAIAPLVDQPDWYVQRAHDLLSGQRLLAPPDQSLRLEPMRRARLLKDMVHGAAIKQYLFGLHREQLSAGRASEAGVLLDEIYEALPKKFRGQSFSEQFEYVSYRVESVKQSSEFAQKLKDELFLKVDSWRDYRSILDLEDKGDGEEFAPFVLSTFDKFVGEADSAELLEVYGELLQYMPNDQSDLELTRKVGARLRTPAEFVELVKMAAGEGIEGRFDDHDLLSLYVAENWERFFPEDGTWEQRLRYCESLLDRISNRADLQIRSGLLRRAKNFREMRAYLALSNLDLLDAHEKMFLSKLVSDSVMELVSKSSIEGLLHRDMDLEALKKYLTPEDLGRVMSAVAQRAVEAGDFERLVAARRLAPGHLLAGSGENSPLLRSYVAAHYLDESFFRLRGTVLQEALSGSKAKDIAGIYESARRASWRDYLKWRRVLKGGGLLPARDAKGLSAYLRIVMELPPEQQRKVLERMKGVDPVVITDLLPEHEVLIVTLERWARDLESAGISDSARLLGKSFPITRLR